MDIKLDATGDIDLSTGDLQILSGSTATAQRLARTLKTFKGEWFLDTRIGMPWRTDVLTKPARLDRIKTRISQAALATEGVDAVISLVLSYDTSSRALTVTGAFRESSGQVITFTNLPIIP